MADFNFYLNRQGVKGRKGDQGEQGFSPIITVKTQTASEYVLNVQNEDGSFDTPNLRGNAIENNGGNYVRYNPVTEEMYTGYADYASYGQSGQVQFATYEQLAAGGAEELGVASKDVYDFVNSQVQDLGFNALSSTLVEGNNITLVLDAESKTITINSTDTGISLTDLSIDSGSSNYLSYDNTTGKFSAKVDTTVTQNSSKLITSGAVYDAIPSLSGVPTLSGNNTYTGVNTFNTKNGSTSNTIYEAIVIPMKSDNDRQIIIGRNNSGQQLIAATKGRLRIGTTSNNHAAVDFFQPTTTYLPSVVVANVNADNTQYSESSYHPLFNDLNFSQGTGVTISSSGSGSSKTYTISANIASSVDSSSTNAYSVGAKLFYDTLGDIETLLNNINSGNGS